MSNKKSITINRQKVDFFNSMQYFGPNGKEHEISGQILLNSGDNNVKGTKIFFGGDSNTFLPQGALTFHKHTVLDSIKQSYMSTDVPSPTDMVSIGLSILYHGAEDHVIFTPNYTYVITWYGDALKRLKMDARDMSVNQVEQIMNKNLEKLYKVVQDNEGGKNYGQSFCEAWIQALRSIGYDIRVFNKGEPVQFNYGPVEVSDMDSSISSILKIESSMVGDHYNKRSNNRRRRKMQSLAYILFAVAILFTSMMAIKSKISQ